jgi:multidrug transporter EmrE-like cation transporter
MTLAHAEAGRNIRSAAENKLNMKLAVLTLTIGIGVALTVLADIFLKKSGWSNWYWIAAGAFVYAVAAIFVADAFHYTEFGRVFLVWEIIAVILGMLVAGVYYKEPFTIYRFVALILAFAAIYFSYK